MAEEPRRLRYVGPHVAVEVPSLGATVERNHQIAVDDPAIAAALLDQEDWREVGAAKEPDKAEKKEAS